MFLEKSRYFKLATEDVSTRDGRKVTALRLRRLPATTGEPYCVQGSDRLDVLAHGRFADGTRFWHIADANSALDARELTAVTNTSIDVPQSR